MPKISIITVTFNSSKTLAKTIQSVVNQTYKNIEYIVIDGGSTDGTLDIIKKYDNYITQWVSEHDNGIYDAMNKGINLATGDYVYMLNADDVLSNETVLEEIANILAQTECDGICGYITYIDEKGKKLNSLKTKPNDPFSYLVHQGFIYKKSLHEKYGLYDTTYLINADYDFYLKLLKDCCFIKYVPIEVAHMAIGGFSSRHLLISEAETLHIRLKNKLPFIKTLTKFWISVCKSLVRAFLLKINMQKIIILYKRVISR